MVHLFSKCVYFYKYSAQIVNSRPGEIKKGGLFTRLFLSLFLSPKFYFLCFPILLR